MCRFWLLLAINRKKILIEITINDNYKIEVGTKLSQNGSDVHTRPLGGDNELAGDILMVL